MADSPKNAGKAPSVQFYHKDFYADMVQHPNHIVGAWSKILCKIWLQSCNGKITATVSQFSRIIGENKARTLEVLEYIKEEDIAGVTHNNGKITVVNRRAQRDAKLKEDNRLRQQRFREKHQNNADVTPKNPNPSSSTSSSTSIKKHISASDFMAYWNSKDLKKIREMSKGRKTHLKARSQDEAFCENWETIIDKFAESDFCRGKNWATVDFVLANDTNYIKILEGKYDNEKPKRHSPRKCPVCKIQPARNGGECGSCEHKRILAELEQGAVE